MQVLEVRFYPRSKAVPSFVVVGNVICDEQGATIAPQIGHNKEVKPFEFGGLLTKLRFLVEAAVPEPGSELLGLRSQFWSFVDVSAERTGGRSG